MDVAKSSKLQDADWLGKVLNAARTGDAAGMKKLLQDENAKAKLKKLRKPVEVRGVGQQPADNCQLHQVHCNLHVIDQRKLVVPGQAADVLSSGYVVQEPCMCSNDSERLST